MAISTEEQNSWPVPADLTAPRFEQASIVLYDLFRETFRAGQPMIAERTFINCRFEGPAVMAVLDGCDFQGTDFGHTFGRIGSIVIRSAQPGKMVGALPFVNCKFVDCTFFGVGFTGPEPFLQQLLALEA